MPSMSKSQQRLFCMAYAVRKGELSKSKVNKCVLDIVDSDMTNEQIHHFTKLKEMKTMKEIADQNFISEELDRQYDKIIEALQEAKKNNVPLDEGLFSSILGGVAGTTFGPSVMSAICKALGIDEKGQLGKLMTSRLILGAVGAMIGWKV